MEKFKIISSIIEIIALAFIVYNVFHLIKRVKTLEKKHKNLGCQSISNLKGIEVKAFKNPESFFNEIFGAKHENNPPSLEEQLQEALENDEFEKAAELRDQIANQSKKDNEKK